MNIQDLKKQFDKLREEDHDDFCRAYSRHEFYKWVYDNYPNVYFEPKKGKISRIKLSHELRFINTDWIEAHHDIVAEISRINSLDKPYGLVRKATEENGISGMYDLGIKLTDEFIKLHEKTIWGEELEYYETIELFLNQKLSK